MSFETSLKFLIDTCFELGKENLKSPSANLVVGNSILNGTGFFDIIHQ